MGRLEKLKRQLILEANMRLLNESSVGPLDATPLNFSVGDFQPMVDGLNKVIVDAAKNAGVDLEGATEFVKLTHKTLPQPNAYGPANKDQFRLEHSGGGGWNTVAFVGSPFNSGYESDKWGVRASGDDYASQADQDAGTYYLTDRYNHEDNASFLKSWTMPGGKRASNTLRNTLRLPFGSINFTGTTPDYNAKFDLTRLLVALALGKGGQTERQYKELGKNPGGVFKKNNNKFFSGVQNSIGPVMDKYVSDMKSKVDGGYTQVWNGLTSQATR